MITPDFKDKSRPPPDQTVYIVSAERLDCGIDGRPEGDIWSSYSGDTIAAQGKIRKPFGWLGRIFVAVSRFNDQVEAYSIVPARLFNGPPTTYREKLAPDGGESARNDPNGFYHGMAIQAGKETFILCGPPAVFVPAEDEPPAQMTLF